MNTLQSFDSSKRGDDENYIEDFEVVRQIGRGSFSNVFLCKIPVDVTVSGLFK